MAAASARRLYMFLGGTFLAGGGLIAAACTTDNGGTGNVPTVGDSGRTDTGGSSSGGSSGGSSGDPGDGGGGADCANIPKPKSSDGPFCFGAGAGAGDSGVDASPNANCDSTQNEICCSGGRLPNDGGFAPSQCRVATEDTVGYEVGTTCNGITPVKEYHCMEGAHCPGAGEICCVTVSEAGAPKPGQDNDFPGCPVYFQSGRFTDGTRCRETACQALELQMCSSDAECKAGTCVPITLEGRYGGYCRL